MSSRSLSTRSRAACGLVSPPPLPRRTSRKSSVTKLPDGSTNRLWIWLRRAVAHVATSSCLDPARAPGDVAAYADHEAAHRAHSLAFFRGLPAASAPALALGAVLRGALEKEDRGILETHLAHAGGYGPPHLRLTAVVFVKLHAA